MLKCFVDMYGLPSRSGERASVEILLNEEPCLGDIVAALRREIPSLEGEAIRSGEDRLSYGYIFNINGTVHTDYSENPGDGGLPLRDGDRIALLPLSSGG